MEKITKEDKEHLEWIYKRLIHVHEENERVDYMIKFSKILKKL